MTPKEFTDLQTGFIAPNGDFHPCDYMDHINAADDVLQIYYGATGGCDPESELIVISDDIDLEPGRIRIRKQGSAGGQNGLRHIVQCLGTQKFIRIRGGTGGKPEGWELADWVLSRFTMDDRALVDDAIVRAEDAVTAICTDGIDKAMNIYNVKA